MKKGEKIDILFQSLCSLGVNRDIYLDDFKAVIEDLDDAEKEALFNKIYESGYSIRRNIDSNASEEIQEYLYENPYRIKSKIDAERFKYNFVSDDNANKIVNLVKNDSLDESSKEKIVQRLNIRYIKYIYDNYNNNYSIYLNSYEAEKATMNNLDCISKESLNIIIKKKMKLNKNFKYKLIIDEAMKKQSENYEKKCYVKRKRP